jgi:hypothetical protein
MSVFYILNLLIFLTNFFPPIASAETISIELKQQGDFCDFAGAKALMLQELSDQLSTIHSKTFISRCRLASLGETVRLIDSSFTCLGTGRKSTVIARAQLECLRQDANEESVTSLKFTKVSESPVAFTDIDISKLLHAIDLEDTHSARCKETFGESSRYSALIGSLNEIHDVVGNLNVATIEQSIKCEQIRSNP